MLLGIELLLAILAVVLALKVPNLGSRWFEAVERSFGKLAQRRGLSVLVVGLSALVLRAALLPIEPIPHPLIQDEFAYLLGADTFAHGRLTNPTPPMWTHFESIAVIMRPTYNSKYPPAQSFFLAAGQVIAGHPFWGVWLSVGLMCAAICWMLQGWIGEGWALLGGFLAVARIAGFSYWGDSYWGGAVAALGGALVLGALARIKQGRRVRYALLMGLGLAILANSRPYDGLVLSLPVAVALFVWMLGKHRPPISVSLRQVVLPLCLLLGLAGAAMGYYNWRVTGNPLKLPYQVFWAQYDPSPYFLWQSEQPLPMYRHATMRHWETEGNTLKDFRRSRSLGGLTAIELEKAISMWQFFVGFLLLLPLAVVFLTLPYGFSLKDISPPARFLLTVFGVSVVGLGLEVLFFPHYAAPITCVFLALILLAMSRVRQYQWRGKPAGLFLVRVVPAFTLLLLLLRAAVAPFNVEPRVPYTAWFSRGSRTSGVGRSHILAELHKRPGRQLVFVRYVADLYNKEAHMKGMWPPAGVWEWVYNGVNIGEHRVVWAHDMGPAQNEELIKYYKDRHAWLLEADEQPPKLLPYTAAEDRAAQTGAEENTAAARHMVNNQ